MPVENGENVLGSLPTPESIERYLREEWTCDDETCRCHVTGGEGGDGCLNDSPTEPDAS